MNSSYAEYLGNQITQGKLNYEEIIKIFPRYKEQIDSIIDRYNLIPTVEEESVDE